MSNQKRIEQARSVSQSADSRITLCKHRQSAQPPVLNRPQRDALFEAMRWESGSVFSDFAHFPVDESKFRVPVLTVATSKDRLIWPSLVRRMANKYANVGGEYREYPDHGHWLPEEPGWELVAADIYSWLRNAIVRGQSVRDTYVRKGGYRKAS